MVQNILSQFLLSNVCLDLTQNLFSNIFELVYSEFVTSLCENDFAIFDDFRTLTDFISNVGTQKLYEINNKQYEILILKSIFFQISICKANKSVQQRRIAFPFFLFYCIFNRLEKICQNFSSVCFFISFNHIEINKHSINSRFN